MKHFTLFTLALAFCFQFCPVIAQSDQEKLDLPGDNLNLYATLKLFQESETLEGFEKALNEESTQINNLDLNGDDLTDYIQVRDHVEEDVHYISLKIAVTEEEDQDVAVFIVQRDQNGQVQIQLIGDEDLYGKDYIIEPNSEAGGYGATPNPGYDPGNSPTAVEQNNTVYQVSAWPVIRYIYVPTYRIWHSPWHWNAYPSYWRPWRTSYWHYYYGYHYNMYGYYHGNYRRSVQYRYPAWRTHYYAGSMRSSSVIVINRTKRGDYNRTYSKPGLARDGYRVFRKNNPTISTGNTRPPAFDRSGRPVVKRPETNRPALPRPGTEGPSPSRPVTRPGTSRPESDNTSPTRPVTRPGSGNTTSPSRPATTRPAARNPASSRPAVNKPATRSRDAAKPATGKPATRERGPR